VTIAAAGRQLERTKRQLCITLLAGVQLGVAVSLTSSAEEATFTSRQLTPETALKAAQAALAKCRGDGYQVSVAVVDRAGLTQVLIRDRYAGPHTVETATNKAWSAVSIRNNPSDIEKGSRPGG